MRYFVFVCLISAAVIACDEDDPVDPRTDAGVTADAGIPIEPDGGTTTTTLQQPGIARPPINGFPEELRPPR